MTDISDDAAALRRGIRDLVALTTLPGIWAESSPDRIAESLSEVVMRMLNLDLVYIRLHRHHSPADEPDILYELIRVPGSVCSVEEVQQISPLLTPYLSRDNTSTTRVIANPFGSEMLTIAILPV